MALSTPYLCVAAGLSVWLDVVNVGPIVGWDASLCVINDADDLGGTQEECVDLGYREPGDIVDQLLFCLLIGLGAYCCVCAPDLSIGSLQFLLGILLLGGI